MYEIFYSKRAVKDIEKLKSAGLDGKAKELVETVKRNPYQNPPRYEKLLGDWAGYYSRRINRHHRLIYKVDEARKIVKIYRLWTHYE
jgi:Txe/YoeB family toxin of toxin-antitoxin system